MLKKALVVAALCLAAGCGRGVVASEDSSWGGLGSGHNRVPSDQGRADAAAADTSGKWGGLGSGH